MRIHIIKVLKYTNSILARFSSGPFLPPLSPLLVFSTKSERVCSIEWDRRERGMDRCCSECRRAPPPPLLLSCHPAPQPCRCRKKQNFSNYSSLRLRMLAVGREAGGRDRRECRKEGTLFIVGRTKEEEGLSKEGGSERGTKCFRIA